MFEQPMVRERQKSFNMDEGIKLPLHFSRYQAGEFSLLIAPEKASFISANGFGVRFAEYFRQGYTIQQVIDFMKNEGVEMDRIVSELHTFLVRVERKGFYEDAPVQVFKDETFIHIDVTNRCNLSCIQCLQNAGKPRENELNTEEWLNVIDEFCKFHKGRITVSGGEPLLHPGIFEILERAKYHGMEVTLFTNGTLISDEEIARKLEKCVDRIQISLDGATSEDNDKIRGNGSFEKIIKAFQLLGKTKIELNLSICLMPQNKDTLHREIEVIMNRIGAEVNLKISPVIKMGRANDSQRFKDEKTANSEVLKLLSEVYLKKLRSLPVEVKNFMMTNCGYGESVVISSNGDVFPCNIYESRVKLGNVRDNDFSRMITVIDGLRERVSVENIPLCKSCDLRYICMGGCRLNNIYQKNDILISGCTAEYKKNFIDYIINYEENLDPSMILMKMAQDNKMSIGRK